MPRITAIYIAVSTLLLIILALEVVLLRRDRKVSLGFGGDKDLGRAIRIHGNYAENVPFALLVLLGLELIGAPSWELHAVGASVLVSRLMHRAGIRGRGGTSVGRSGGMAVLWCAMGFGATDLLRRAVSG